MSNYAIEKSCTVNVQNDKVFDTNIIIEENVKVTFDNDVRINGSLLSLNQEVK